MAELTTEQLVEHLSGLTVLQLNDLRKALEEKWGVEAAAPMAAMAMAALIFGKTANGVPQNLVIG